MKKHFVCFLLLIIFIMSLFAGCIDPNPPNGNHNDDMEKFIGTWNTTDPIPWYIKPEFKFFADGSFDVQGYGGNFTVDEDILTLTWDDQGKIYTYEYEFIDNSTVKLTYTGTGDQGIYNRQ